MASKPGPLCQGRNPVNTSDGTLCSAQSPQPGVHGDRSWLDSAWDTVADDAAWVSGKARDGAAWVGSEARAGAAWVGNEASAGAQWAADKTSQAYHYVAGAVDAAWKSRILPMLTRLYHFSQRELLGIWCLIQAREEALKILDATILEETGYELVSMLGGVIEGLIDAMIQIGVITLIGGVIGGAIGAVLGALAGAPAAGVGAIPGAIAGAAEGGAVGLDVGFDVGVWYVTIIGLKFLVDALVMGFKEMFAALKNYVTWAWAAKDLGPALRAAQIKRAGKELARAFGIFMRFVLLALILYVTKKALEFGGGAKGEAEGLEKTTDELGKSGLGPRFARWFKEKFPELKRKVNELKNRGAKRVPEDEAPQGTASSNGTGSTRPGSSEDTTKPPAPKELSCKVSSGATLRAEPGKTTTVLGRYKPDMKKVINALGDQKSLDFGAKPGDFNVLNVPKEAADDLTGEEFWEQYNRPWLDQAIDRGDNITLATEPTPEELVNDAGEPTGFGREYDYLTSKGYVYDPVSHTMIKP